MSIQTGALFRATEMDNDTRGWIMSCVSGIACVLGAGIVCIDVLAAKLFGSKSFKIVESQTFLSASLSLSAGVLIFTSLYSMLPTANKYLVQAGYSAHAAAYMMIGLFLLGVVAIRIVSALIHSRLPSSVIECDPEHAPEHAHAHKDVERGDGGEMRHSSLPDRSAGGGTNERSPLLQHARPQAVASSQTIPADGTRGNFPTRAARHASYFRPRPSLGTRLSQQVSAIVLQTKPDCDENGRCLGFSQPCRDGCVRCMRHPVTVTQVHPNGCQPDGQQPIDEPTLPLSSAASAPSGNASRDGLLNPTDDATVPLDPHEQPQFQPIVEVDNESPTSTSTAVPTESPAQSDSHADHHHHVPRDEFMSLGLQTSLAIALHKLPEGFITYATNHASPTLGWSVFVALFIHNITEGFAMCLPLYLALDSRLKAMIWSSLLGGISQPAGAGIAALWFWGSRNGNSYLDDGTARPDDPSWAVYGGMFAVTAGVMTNVSLQLFSESLHRSKNHSMCICFVVAGMGVLGLSFALTAE